jgi:hypothetical protein
MSQEKLEALLLMTTERKILMSLEKEKKPLGQGTALEV